MFLSNRLRAATALTLTLASAMVSASAVMAQAPLPQATQAPAAPPILGVNDPQNPFHYTADQQKIFYSLKVQFQQQATQVLNDKSLSAAQKNVKITALQKAAFDQFNKSLSPDQLAKQKQVVAIRSQYTAKYQSLNAELKNSITAQQKQDLIKTRSTANDKAKAIIASSASQQDKQQQIGDLQKSFEAQMLSIFTASQRGMITQMQDLKTQEPAAVAKVLAGH